MSDKILEFKKAIKKAAPGDWPYVLVCVDPDGHNGFVEHGGGQMNGYQMLGILEWGKSLILEDTKVTK